MSDSIYSVLIFFRTKDAYICTHIHMSCYFEMVIWLLMYVRVYCTYVLYVCTYVLYVCTHVLYVCTYVLYVCGALNFTVCV